MQASPQFFVDEYGCPFDERIHAALTKLGPDLQRDFPALQDDCLVTEVLEEVGRALVAIERRYGPITKLDAYARKAARRVAKVRLAHDEWTAAYLERLATLDVVPSSIGTPERIEASILCDQLYGHLTPQECQIVKGWQGGLSFSELTVASGLSVHKIWRRAKRKLHDVVARAPRHSHDELDTTHYVHQADH